MVEEGKIKYIGLSEASVDTIRRAHAVHPITAVQMEYSLWARDIEDEIVPVCRELGIGIVAYSPLGRGFFAGKAVLEPLPPESVLSMFPRFSGKNFEENKNLYKKLANLAEKHACTTPQLALAWLLHQGGDIVPIPGTTKVRNLDNNIGSLAIKLSEDDLKEICDAVPIDEVVGSRQIAALSLGLEFCQYPIKVSRLGFGCGGLSGILNAPLSHEAGCSVLKEAFYKGITFFDTANAYGRNHDNEIMIGKALKQLPRERIQLATKFGFSISEEGQMSVKCTPEYARECCEASLKYLDVDYIDLYYQHRVDTSVPIENTMEELKKLVEEGKIKYIGLSEASADTIRRAHAVHPITALQMEYSLWTRDIEDEIIPLCRELGIGIVAYSPLGHGFFGGKGVVESFPNDSFLAVHPRFMGENLEKNKLLYARLSGLAAKHACTLPQLALAWLLHQGDDIIPIPGTTKVKNLDSNIGSLALKLTQEDLKEISEAVPANEVSGERDPAMLAKFEWKNANTPPK